MHVEISGSLAKMTYMTPLVFEVAAVSLLALVFRRAPVTVAVALMLKSLYVGSVFLVNYFNLASTLGRVEYAELYSAVEVLYGVSWVAVLGSLVLFIVRILWEQFSSRGK